MSDDACEIIEREKERIEARIKEKEAILAACVKTVIESAAACGVSVDEFFRVLRGDIADSGVSVPDFA